MIENPSKKLTPEQRQERSESSAKFLKDIHRQYLAYDEEVEDQDNWLFRGEDEDYAEAA